jgi:cystathionine gamma-lyase
VSDGLGTRAVHAGLPAPEHGAPFLPGPGPRRAHAPVGDADPAGYGRYGNPTWARYEAAVGELEGGDALVFSSGMAAASAVLLALLEPGDVLVAPGDAYPGVRTIATEHLEPRGIEVRLVPTDDAAIRSALPGAALVWIETPSNPAWPSSTCAGLAGRATPPAPCSRWTTRS